MLLSTIFIGGSFYTEIRVIPIPKKGGVMWITRQPFYPFGVRVAYNI